MTDIIRTVGIIFISVAILVMFILLLIGILQLQNKSRGMEMKYDGRWLLPVKVMLWLIKPFVVSSTKK